MAKYNVHIQPTTNFIGDPGYFSGTGFMGAGFNTREELAALMKKYATFTKDGESYWREEIKLTLEFGKPVEAFKAEGNRQCKENGFVNLFTAALTCTKDPFYGIKIIYRPGAWIDKDGNEFKFVVIKGDEVTPKAMKLSEILREIGIDI